MPIVRTSSGKHFESREGEALLDAALRADVALAYSCRTGRCSTCKGQVRAGRTLALRDELGLTPAERDAGWILTCVHTAISDVEVAVEDLGDVVTFAAQTIPCRIHSLRALAEDVVAVQLRLPPRADFRFHPGQYIDVIGAGGIRRSYSIANAPAADRMLELHVRRVPGGEMSQYWFDGAKPNDLLRLHGPLGTFFLREIDDLDLLFLATGTGIAPVKAMLEGLVRPAPGIVAPRPRSVTVIWGGRRPRDLYWDLRVPGSNHRYFPVLSQADSAWTGARGYVQQVALVEQSDWTCSTVYACGSDAMIHAARPLLSAAGLDPRRFHSDAFVSSGNN